MVYIKGRDLNNPLTQVTTDRGWYYPKQTYARYEYLRDFLRNRPGDDGGGDGLYIEASPRWTRLARKKSDLPWICRFRNPPQRIRNPCYAPTSMQYFFLWSDTHLVTPPSGDKNMCVHYDTDSARPDLTRRQY